MLRILRKRPNYGRFSVRKVCGKLRIFGRRSEEHWHSGQRFRRFPHSLRNRQPLWLKAFRKIRRIRKRADLKVLASVLTRMAP